MLLKQMQPQPAEMTTTPCTSTGMQERIKVFHPESECNRTGHQAVPHTFKYIVSALRLPYLPLLSCRPSACRPTCQLALSHSRSQLLLISSPTEHGKKWRAACALPRALKQQVPHRVAYLSTLTKAAAVIYLFGGGAEERRVQAGIFSSCTCCVGLLWWRTQQQLPVLVRCFNGRRGNNAVLLPAGTKG
jgi:hypothetical protein